MTALSFAEAVPLGAASAVRLAADHGIRVLLVKGPALQEQGLRGVHHSTDIDLWVDPASHEHFLAALADHDWLPLPRIASQELFAHHAVTVRHHLWPVTLDVHDRFPGFLADPQVVFEVLWESRSAVPCAGVELPTPGAPAHAALAALHYLRVPGSGLAMNALPDLVSRVPGALGTNGLRDLTRIAEVTGASTSLSAFLAEVGAPAPDPTRAAPGLAPESVAEWERFQHDVTGQVGLRSVLAQPWSRRPATLIDVLGLRAEDIDLLRLPGESRTAARFRRLRRATSSLPGAVRQTWSGRTRQQRTL